jgi:hypothetical protein
VTTDSRKELTYRYKKVLGGILLDLQSRIFAFLEELDSDPGPGLNSRIESFISDELKQDPGMVLQACEAGEISERLRCFLNRPIRVCGMVRNEGEPGGGPFWVRDSKGVTSLQIVESSQIDMNNREQTKHLQSATHFNPVDLVCATKDYKGNRFDLHQFIDPETGFISKKSKGGKNLKALELPGLWNGAMANWITLFVEVPIITFNPVKTVNDLLRAQHQPG